MNRKTLFIIGGVILVVCLGCAALIGIAFVGGMLGTQPAATVGDSFMTALKDGNYSQAYGLCAPDLQKELGNASGLQTLIKNAQVQPTQWSFSSRNITNDVGELDGSVTFANNREGTVRLVLGKAGSDWKITGFNLKPK